MFRRASTDSVDYIQHQRRCVTESVACFSGDYNQMGSPSLKLGQPAMKGNDYGSYSP